LLGFDFGFRARNIVQRNEMYAAMIERMVCRSQDVPEEAAAVLPGILFSWHRNQAGRVHAGSDLLKALHSTNVCDFVISVMGKVSGNLHQVG